MEGRAHCRWLKINRSWLRRGEAVEKQTVAGGGESTLQMVEDKPQLVAGGGSRIAGG